MDDNNLDDNPIYRWIYPAAVRFQEKTKLPTRIFCENVGPAKYVYGIKTTIGQREISVTRNLDFSDVSVFQDAEKFTEHMFNEVYSIEEELNKKIS